MSGMNEVDDVFIQILKQEPYKHQRCVWEALKNGQSVVLRAPAGSGKTEAIFLPFGVFSNDELQPRMLYALPLRALVNQIRERLENHAKKLGRRNWRVRLQHGQRPESVLFAADVTVATIDQVITSYACTPLTLPVRHGNIPAGAVMNSFLVFDEVHLFDPELALQGMCLICERLYRLSLPFAILSATLPDSVLDFWRTHFGCEVIDASQDPIKRNVRLEWKGESLTHVAVHQALKLEFSRILVICNTVERAINLFDQVRTIAQKEGYECQLLHARFLPDDRQAKEEWLELRFGKNPPPDQDVRSLLIATQVVEVGLDVSCDCLLTELAPIDALIQRAGRCARWGGNGWVQVYNVERASPYDQNPVERTLRVLERNNPVDLTWSKAKAWVNEVLGKAYKSILSEGSVEYERVVARLSRASFEGSRVEAEQAVRETNTVEVTVHHNPQSLNEAVLRLPTISVHIGIARQWLKGLQQRVWRVEVDHRASDAKVSIHLKSVREHDIRIGDRLVFPPSMLTYDGEKGLRSGKGEAFLPLSVPPRPQLETALREEGWTEHASHTAEFVHQLLSRDRHAVRSLTNLLGVEMKVIEKTAFLGAVLHDLGKLSVGWQRKAGVAEDASVAELLAHTDGRNYEQFPPHATVSAYALWSVLTESDMLPRLLGRALAFAIAHHHSVRAQQVPEYRLHPSWRDAVQQAIRQAGVNDFPLNEVVSNQRSTTALRESFPSLEYERLYTAYVLLARWLRLADRMATGGGEDAIFRYENWFGGL